MLNATFWRTVFYFSMVLHLDHHHRFIFTKPFPLYSTSEASSRCGVRKDQQILLFSRVSHNCIVKPGSSPKVMLHNTTWQFKVHCKPLRVILTEALRKLKSIPDFLTLLFLHSESIKESEHPRDPALSLSTRSLNVQSWMFGLVFHHG